MNTKRTPEDLIAEAKAKDISYQEIDESLKIDCAFISCKKKAVLYLDDFHVCVDHGFRLIQCLTEKLGNDTVGS
jgi:hypothetical protein